MYLPITPCSLKRTSSVLDEHEEALKKKLEVVQHNAEQQRYVCTHRAKNYCNIDICITRAMHNDWML